MILKPWPLISSLAYPMRRRADRMPLLLIGLESVLGLGKTYLPCPVKGWISCRISRA